MSNSLTVLFVIVLVVLLLGSLWYVPFRLSRLLHVKRRWPLYVAVPALFVLNFVTMSWVAKTSNAAIDLASNVFGLAFGGHVFLILVLLFADGARLVARRVEGETDPCRLERSDRRIGWGALIVAALLTAMGAYRAQSFQVNRVEIAIDGLEQAVTVMLITDVHIGHQRGRAYLEQIVEETNRHEPDLVLIAGDLVDAKTALEPGVLEPLAHFEAPAYFTTGNHEVYVGLDRALQLIASHGVRILHNEMVQTHGLQLVGLDYMNADEQAFDMHAVNKVTIKEELPKIALQPGKPVVLMHHSPVGVDYVAARGVALMVSGHTHAGQIVPATLGVPLVFPLHEGLYRRNGTQVFVSQGAGTFGPRMRLGSSSEINLIRLVPAR